MDLGNGLFIALVLGYFYLLKAVLNKSVSCIVELWIETYETEKDVFGEDRPVHIDIYTKHCKFTVAPAIGVEFQTEGIAGAIVERVILDEQKLCQVICKMKVLSRGGEFEKTARALTSASWSKRVQHDG